MSNRSFKSLFHDKHEQADDDHDAEELRTTCLGAIPCKWCLIGFIIGTLIVGIILSIVLVMYMQGNSRSFYLIL